MKIITIVLTAFLLSSCLKIPSQNSSNCGIFLKPLLDFELYAGENKSEILSNLDQNVQLFGYDLKYTPKEIDVYNGKKEIILPNGYKSNTEFSIRFKGEELVGYKVFMEIGKDYNYAWDLLELIKKQDKENINDFLYPIGKKFSYLDFKNNNHCKRMITIGRDNENPELFEITFASN